MKRLLLSGLLCFAMLSVANAQYVAERSGYEGDYFSLEGALDLFQDSRNLKQFERRLNREDNWVNNLDLNYDGQIDYIRVEHSRQGSFHAIVMQAIISRYEVQDVAVIEIEKVGRYDAVLQIVGDADLYGEEVIVESRRDNDYYASSVSYRGYDNVYYWQPVQYIFSPQYVVYASPYRWSYYPTWWSPWRQCSWNVFYPRIVNYHTYYHVVNVHRVVNVHNYYYPSRTYCDRVVYQARQVRTQHGHSNAYRATRQKNDRHFASTRNNNVSRPTGRTNQVSAANTRANINKKPSTSRPVSRAPINARPTRSTTTRTSPSKPRTPAVSKKPTRTTSPARTSSTSRSSATRTSPSKPRTPAVSKKPTRTTSPARTSSTSRSSATRTSPSKPRTPAVSKKPTRTTSPARSSNANRSRTTRPAPSKPRTPAVSRKPARTASPAKSSSSKSSRAVRPAPSRQAKPAVRKPATSNRAKSSSPSNRRSAPVKKQAQRSGRG